MKNPTLITRELGLRIRQARRAAGLRQADVAASIGLSESMICYLERGKRGLQFVDAVRIARLLGVKLEELAAGF